MRSYRGPGFTDEQWEKMDQSQRRMAFAVERAFNAVSHLSVSLSSGTPLTREDRRTQQQLLAATGAGNDNVETLTRLAASLDQSRQALRAGADTDFVATGYGEASWLEVNDGDPRARLTSQATRRGAHGLLVNLAHPNFLDDRRRDQDTGHESFHSGAGLEDQLADPADHKSVAYRNMGGGANYRKLRETDPARAVVNPDHIVEFVENFRPHFWDRY